MKLAFTQLVDIKQLEALFEDLYKATKYPVSLIDLDGTVLFSFGWQEICIRYHRQAEKSFARCFVSEKLIKDNFINDDYIQEFKCGNGLREIALPIMVAGYHSATVFIGQFLYDDEEINYNYFEKQAAELGIDKKVYLELLKQVPRYNRQNIHNHLKFQKRWIDYISSQAYTKYKLLYEIDERKLAEDTLRENEAILNQKLNVLLNPNENITQIALKELLKLEDLQKMQDSFAQSVNVASIITDLDGKPITNGSNFSKVCKMIRATDKGNANCLKSDKILGEKANQSRKAEYHKCHSCGFLDASAPIIVGGKHIANWLIGQNNVLNVGEVTIEKYAKEIGVNPVEMLEAYKEMPQMPLEQFSHAVNLLWIMANALSNLAYNNILLAREVENRKIAQNQLKQLNQELEERIISRTYQLEEALEELKIENEERARTENELYEAKEELSKALSNEKELGEMKTRFISMVSHEYRTPLTIIQSSAYLIEQYALKNDLNSIKRQINKIETSITHMTRLLDDVLMLGKQESGKFIISLNEIDMISYLNEIINEVLTMDAMKHKIKLISNKPQIQFVTDTIILHQIVINLLTNALKYSEIDSIINTYIDEQEDRITITISDNGIGISEEDLHNIFEPFQRGDNVGAVSGSGLGLAIVKRCVDMLEGYISVKSEINKGTSFSISLPKLVNCKIENE